MNTVRNSRAMVLVAACCVLLATARAAIADPTKQAIEKAVAALSTYDFGQSRKALRQVEAIVRETRGSVELRVHLEKEMLRLLRSDATLASKQFVCQKLRLMGTEACIPPLAEMLLDPKTTEIACCALSSQRSRKVDRALRGALERLRGKPLIAVINLLAERRDPQSVEALARIASGADTTVVATAIAALGKISTHLAAKVLASLRESKDAIRRSEASHASLQCAREMAAKGQRSDAVEVYRRLSAPEAPPPVRRGALLGWIELGGAKALSEIVSSLRDQDDSLRQEVDRLVGRVFDEIPAVPIFDGKSRNGWEGDPAMFRIEAGAIVGGTLDRRIPHNLFLCTRKEYGDFELRLKVKLIGRGDNAGIQVRSRRLPGSHEVSGYQADMGTGCWGCLYDESRRRTMLARVRRDELSNVLRPDDWNEYVIRCVGPRIQLWINEHQTVDYTEPDDGIPRRGVIGLQIHGGAPAEAWYREIAIRELASGS